MELSKNDLQLLKQVNDICREKDKKSLVASRALLSDELLAFFNVSNSAQGFWCFNIYVEFEPLIKIQEAKDWQ